MWCPVHTTTGCGSHGFLSAQPYLSHILCAASSQCALKLRLALITALGWVWVIRVIRVRGVRGWDISYGGEQTRLLSFEQVQEINTSCGAHLRVCYFSFIPPWAIIRCSQRISKGNSKSGLHKLRQWFHTQESERVGRSRQNYKP